MAQLHNMPQDRVSQRRDIRNRVVNWCKQNAMRENVAVACEGFLCVLLIGRGV